MSDQPPPDPYSSPAPDPYATPQPPPAYGAPPPPSAASGPRLRGSAASPRLRARRPPPGYGAPPTYPPQGYPAQGYPPPPPAATNGLAIGALIVGIIGLILCWIPFGGAVLPLVALLLGFLGVRRANQIAVGKGMAITGIVLGILGLVACALITIVFTVFVHKVVQCGDSNLTNAQQQQCIRDNLNIPSFAPS